MNKLFIATTNPGKLREFKEGFADLEIELLSLKDFSDISSVEETGATFEENAILKAKHGIEHTGLPTIADDGGLEVDALGGKPGVHSHRCIDPERIASDDELIDHILKNLEGVPKEKRTAQLRVVCVFNNGDFFHTVTTAIKGVIVEERPERYEAGFPYRALLYIPKYQKLFGDLTQVEHDEINHRTKAIQELKPIIAEHLLLGGSASK